MPPQLPKPAEKKVSWPEPDVAAEQGSRNINPQPPPPPTATTNQFAVDCWFDDACILDMDYFIKTLSGVKAKGVRPDLIGSIIVHYASKWLPDLAADAPHNVAGEAKGAAVAESALASWLKKRFFVETLVGILPTEKDSISCNFLLRLLRTANMVGAEAAYREELEKRVALQLEQASLKELMIPGFSHTCGTLLDVELVARLVRRFVAGLDEGVGVWNGAALVKVGKLIDCYLAEVAVDANLALPEFMALGGALPSHARATDDGLYRAIDTYLKAHPKTSKQERKALCRLIDSRKLSPEASLHAAQNDRLPVRAVIQVLLSAENTRLSRHIDWSGSFSAGTQSPSPMTNTETSPLAAGRCASKREVAVQQMEIRRLREDVMKLQSQCSAMQAQLEKLVEKKKKGLFRWPTMGGPLFRSAGGAGAGAASSTGDGEGDTGLERQTPAVAVAVKGRTVVEGAKTEPPRWRKSLS